MKLAVTNWEVDILITFDELGVSHHHNHIQTHFGVKQSPVTIPKYYLRTWPIYSKYSLWFSNPSAGDINVALYQPKQVWTLMQCHSSQFVWFRRLYLLFSRYVHYNELHK